jgi:hypothetical protein
MQERLKDTFNFGNFAVSGGKYTPSPPLNSNKFVAFFSFLVALFLSGPLYGQTDYWFVVEKTAQKNAAAFQYLVSALASGNDTAAAVGYGVSASLLFAPQPGNTPNLGALAAAKLVSETVKPISAAGLEQAIALADEQAAAYDRSANRTLIIITTAATSGKTQSPAPVNFGSILYLALDAELDPDIEAIAKPGNVWQITSTLTEAEAEAAGVYTLAGGLYNSTKKLAPAYKRIPVNADSVSFSLGNFVRQLIFQNRRTLILAANTAPGDVEILKEGKRLTAANRNRREAYTIVYFDNTSSGDFRLENGEIILAAGWQRISPLVYIAGLGLVIAAVVFVFILLGILAKFAAIRKKPVWKAVVEHKGIAGRFTAEIAQESKGDESFGSGVTIKTLLSDMRVSDTVDGSTVNDAYPRILYDKENKKWFIEYKLSPVSTGIQLPKNGAGFAGIDPFKASQPASAGTPPAKKVPAGKVEIKPVKGSFEATYIFVDEDVHFLLKEIP